MTSTTTGLTTGDFHRLGVLSNGVMTDILTLIGAGGGGAVSSATLPLSISNGVISISLAGYIPTSHESHKVGAADVAFGAYDVGCKTVTLTNGSGVSATFSVGNSGNISIGSDGVLTVPMLNSWHFQSLSFQDSLGVQRTLTPTAT